MLHRTLVHASMVSAIVLAALGSTSAGAQPPTSVQGAVAESARERARGPYQQGLELMRAERFDEAALAFEKALAIDGTFELAYYNLGRTHMARKQYAAAVYALTRARDLYTAEATRSFGNRQERQRYRRDRMGEMEGLLQDLRAVRPQTYQIQEQIRQLEERMRQLEDADRAQGLRPGTLVPAFVSLSLGSAHFRAGNLAEAEQAYLAAVAADPKTAEAHNNLAVVYMETGRYDQAEEAVRAAEKTGFRVAPALKEEIRKRRKSQLSAESAKRLASGSRPLSEPAPQTLRLRLARSHSLMGLRGSQWAFLVSR